MVKPLLLMAASSIFISALRPNSAQENNYCSVDILYYRELSATIPFSIDCSLFSYDAYDKPVSLSSGFGRISLMVETELIDNFKRQLIPDLEKRQSFDTRIGCRVRCANEVDLICLHVSNGIIVNGNLFYENDALRKLIYKQIILNESK